jgi:hypothetical protein
LVPICKKDEDSKEERIRKCLLYSIYSLVSPLAARRTRTAREEGKRKCLLYSIYSLVSPPAARRTRTARRKGYENVFYIVYIL